MLKDTCEVTKLTRQNCSVYWILWQISRGCWQVWASWYWLVWHILVLVLFSIFV